MDQAAIEDLYLSTAVFEIFKLHLILRAAEGRKEEKKKETNKERQKEGRRIRKETQQENDFIYLPCLAISSF